MEIIGSRPGAHVRFLASHDVTLLRCLPLGDATRKKRRDAGPTVRGSTDSGDWNSRNRTADKCENGRDVDRRATRTEVTRLLGRLVNLKRERHCAAVPSSRIRTLRTFTYISAARGTTLSVFPRERRGYVLHACVSAQTLQIYFSWVRSKYRKKGERVICSNYI